MKKTEAPEQVDALIAVTVKVHAKPPSTPLSPIRDFAEEDYLELLAKKIPATKTALKIYLQNTIGRVKRPSRQAACMLDEFYMSECGGRTKVFERSLGRSKNPR